MRIFLTGAKGQLGTDLVERLTASGHELTAVDIDEVDLGMRDDVLAAVEHARPEAIVHPAAFTAVDACESEPDTAFRVNVLGTRHVAEAARRVGAPVTYVSTDYVFDGTKTDPYVEWDTPNPQSVYGRSKLAGERELDPGSTIVRTSWVCGFHGANMVKTILRLAAEPGPLRFVDDQRGHPTFTADLAAVIETLVVERRPGLFHATNQGAVSWYEFARAVLEAARTVVGDGRIIAVHQPHTYSRTQRLAAEFAETLERYADEPVVLDVFGGREDPVPGVTGALVSGRFRDASRVAYIPDWQQAADFTAGFARDGDFVITLGCGNVNLIVPQLLESLRRSNG